MFASKNEGGLVHNTQLLVPQYTEEMNGDFTKEEIIQYTENEK